MKKEKKELIKNTLIILAGKVCTQFISFLLLPLYTSYLISSEFGYVDLVTTYVTLLVPIITLQIEMAVFRYLIDSRDDETKISNIIKSCMVIIVIIPTILLLLYLFISQYLTIKYKFSIGIVIFSSIFSSFFLQVARGLGKNINYSIGCCISGILTVVLNIITIVIFQLGALGMFVSLIISNLIATSYLFISLNLFKYIKKGVINKCLLKEMLKYSIPLIPNGISWWIVNASDRTIISIILGTASNGIFAVANKFSNLFVGMFNVFLLSWTESVSININNENKNSFFNDVVNLVYRGFCSLCLLIIGTMPFVFNLFVNESYNEAYQHIPILMVAMLFSILVGLYSAFYIAQKQTKEIMKTSILSAILNIVVNLLLIKSIGLYAASISTLVAYGLMALYRCIDISRKLGVKLNVKYLMISFFVIGIALFLYYQTSLYYNIILLMLACVFSVLSMKRYLSLLTSFIKQKFTKEKTS